MNLKEIIADSYLAQGFTDEFSEKLAAIADLRDFSAGSYMVREEDDSADLMIMVEGEADIRTNMHGDSIGKIRAPMPFGEVAFIDGKRRSSSVVAITDCKVVFLPELALRELEREPAIAVRALMNLSRVLCSRLRMANQQIAALNLNEEFGA
jgi:CRP-like cAMP-binding protein